MEQIITYPELRLTTEQIIQTISDQVGLDPVEVSLRSSLNEDLGIDGDDWFDLAARFENEHGMKLDGLDFYKHFNDESQIADPSRIIVLLLFFVFYMVFFQWVNQKFEDFYDVEPKKEPLTVGDMIASKFAGQFMRRSEVRFVLG